jgi:hypothetical protein
MRNIAAYLTLPGVVSQVPLKNTLLFFKNLQEK